MECVPPMSGVPSAVLATAPGGKKKQYEVVDAGGSRKTGVMNDVSRLFSLFLFVGPFQYCLLIIFVFPVLLPLRYSILIIALTLPFCCTPFMDTSTWGHKLARFVCRHVLAHFPMKIIYQDRSSIDPSHSYIIAMEPHSVLPLGALVFSPSASAFCLSRVTILGSSALGWVPLVRNLWHWMGLGSVDKRTFLRLLGEGTSCVLTPGGMQECFYLNHRTEVFYLKKRLGYLRIALTTGTSVIPSIAFGQRNIYRYWFPTNKLYRAVSRMLKYAAIPFWGQLGGPVPFPVPVNVVVGRPVAVPRVEGEPSPEQLLEVQGRLFSAFRELYEEFQDEYAKGIDLEIV